MIKNPEKQKYESMLVFTDCSVKCDCLCGVVREKIQNNKCHQVSKTVKKCDHVDLLLV